MQRLTLPCESAHSSSSTAHVPSPVGRPFRQAHADSFGALLLPHIPLSLLSSLICFLDRGRQKVESKRSWKHRAINEERHRKWEDTEI